ncbi:hypothetical protein [Flavobacterium litorale]|uniref:Uncharacterized protein n=1 Tax=Flavobacterium litorale TaxID=2856519 RepID=A0ABX8V3F2_9FLAO|nr:hypothetical protein [Flavobacterium litorale]QYJ67369.1 hypothetical protein K1I41_07265 [Flavobacterium litorale]
MHKAQLKLLYLLLFAILAITGCEHDDVYMNNQNASANGITTKTISYKELQAMPKAMAALQSLKQEGRKKSVYNVRYDFSVDTTDIVLTTMDNNYHSLTFSILRDSTYAPTIENLVLNWEPYREYRAYLAKYTLTPEEIDKIVNDEFVDLDGKATIETLPQFDTAAVIRAKSGTPGEIVVVNGECYRLTYVRVITYSNIPGQREASTWMPKWVKMPCPEEYTDYSLTEGNHPGGAGGVYIPVFNTPYPIPNGPVSELPGISGGSGPSSGNPYHPVLTKPKIVIPNFRECDKVKNALDSGNFRQEVVNLAGTVNDPVNENGVGLNYYGIVMNFTPAPEITAPIPPATSAFPNGYTVVSHTHNVGKLSVFSFADFEAIAKLLAKDKINTGIFVATLSTEKGTHYALTISNIVKFKEFFYHRLNNLGTLSLENKNKYRNSSENAYKLRKKYFDSEQRLIKETVTNNTAVLIQFLTFLKEAKMGVTLFETDATFQNFTQVSLKSNGTIRRTNCD